MKIATLLPLLSVGLLCAGCASSLRMAQRRCEGAGHRQGSPAYSVCVDREAAAIDRELDELYARVEEDTEQLYRNDRWPDPEHTDLPVALSP